MQNENHSSRYAIDDKKRAEIIGLMTLGCSRRKAAQYVGCAPSSITRAVQRDPEFAAQVAKAEQNIETLALANIRAACKQERYWRASAWVLEHRNPEDFATRAPDVMTPDKVNELLTQFTEVILRALPPDQWQHVTTAFDEFIQAAQQEIRDSQPRQGNCPNFCGHGHRPEVGREAVVDKNGTVPLDAVAPSPDSSTQQAAAETGTPIDAATPSTPTPRPEKTANELSTQRPPNGHRELAATTPSTTPESTTTSVTQQKPKNATPPKGVAQNSADPGHRLSRLACPPPLSNCDGYHRPTEAGHENDHELPIATP